MTTNDESRPRGFWTARLEAFSEGVFAIAITFLVLNIAVSSAEGKHLLRSVASGSGQAWRAT